MSDTKELTPTQVARQLIQGTRLVVDLEDQDWQTAAMLLLSALDDETRQKFIDEDVVAFTTNVADHRGRWLNGRVPLPVLNLMAHERAFWEDVVAEYDKMAAVLWPEQQAEADAPVTE